MPNTNLDDSHDHLPDWIKQLRSQSWQIEILIAGSTVYTLFYLSDHLRSFFYAVYPGIDFTLTRTLLLFGIYLVTRILLIGFISNLIIRSVWLAYLGINFAFPAGVNFDKLKNNQESKDILKGQSTILDRVSFLERLSKLSYSISILLAIFMTSVFISTVVINIFLEYIHFGSIIYEAWFSYTIAIFIAVIQIGVIDRIFLSKKSKHPIINTFKRRLSIVLEYITLSFLFRREFLVIKSNTNKWALAVSTSLILGIASLITAYQIGKYWPYGTIKFNFLDDRKNFDADYKPWLSIYDYDINIDETKSVLRASIQSDIIKDRYLKLFVTSWMEFDKKLKDGYDKYNYPIDYKAKTNSDFHNARDSADSLFNLVINDLFVIEIDGNELQNLRWKATIHSKSKTRGYITYIDINELVSTEHKLILFVNEIDRKQKIIKKRWKDIIFWKE